MTNFTNHIKLGARLIVVAAVIFSFVAVAANASPGVIGYFAGFGASPSAGATVSSSGNGGASAGDVYVSETGRVQQFSAANELIRSWGAGVVESGPGNADEVQAVRVDATGGSFRLSFLGQSTADIPPAATASQLDSALEDVSSIGAGGVSVSGGSGDAGGTTPYLVSFDGDSLAGTDQPLLQAAAGTAPLSGGAATVSVYTTRAGDDGFEVCLPAGGDECGGGSRSGVGGAILGGRDIAIDELSGDVYVADEKRISVFGATGEFLRAWGWDTVKDGPDDSSTDEQEEVTVKADGGSFTLSTDPFAPSLKQTTAPIPYDASPAQVKSALDALSSIGGVGGSVTVSGGPGNLDGTSPYLITYRGTLAGDDLIQIGSDATLLTRTGGGASVAVETVQEGGAYEVCNPDDACKDPTSPHDGEGGGFGRPNGGEVRSLAVAPAGAPNAGNVVAADVYNQRVQEFTPTGDFVRAFGWDVDASNPSTGFEVCVAIHDCKAGIGGGGTGQFSGAGGATLQGVTEDSSGNIYTVEVGPEFGSAPVGESNRAQKFAPAGGQTLSPSLFGTSEEQELKVNAAGGQFKLSFGTQQGATKGTGTTTAGSSLVTNVTTSQGEFRVGQRIFTDAGGGLGTQDPSNSEIYRIAAIGPGTLTLSSPSQFSRQAQLKADLPFTTANLPQNASASQVQSALNALPSIASVGGSVTVTGGPGDPGGTTPYKITFNGGRFPRTDQAQIGIEPGATPLSGGTGPGAGTAVVTTTTQGGPAGSDITDGPNDIAVGSGGRVLVAKFYRLAADTCAEGWVSPAETRIVELDQGGAVVGKSDPCAGTHGFIGSGGQSPTLSFNFDTQHPYLFGGLEKFGNAPLNIFGVPSPAPEVAVDPIGEISSSAGTLSGTIDPNGPGTSYPEVSGLVSSYRTTYRVEYKKSSESSWTRFSPDIPVGSGHDPVPFAVSVGGLTAKTAYDLRVVATKPLVPGGTVTAQESFTTEGAPPSIDAARAAGVGIDSADLHALINPQGTETTYRFEYGTTTAYGSQTAQTSIGDSLEPQAVQVPISGLKDAVYHFRVIADNSFGTTTSEDQTFSFHPPVCPNQALRQQTGTAYLPDCRAYELVSPGYAGGATLYSGGPQSPYATSPSRLAFVGQFAEIPGAGTPINTTGDLYIATRGAEGWTSKYIGPPSTEAACVGGRPITSGTGDATTMQNDVFADPGLGRVIDWNLGNPFECLSGRSGGVRFRDNNTAARGSNAPYVWSASGGRLDRWPTSVADVTGAKENFDCPQDPSIHPYPDGYSANVPVPYFCSTYVTASKDLTHFVFSSQRDIYGGGPDALAQAPGSAYDNDTEANTLTLVSIAPGGGPIGQEPGAKAGPEELIQFPAISADGSRILMGTADKPACKQVDYPNQGDNPLCPIITQPTHLYMRVDHAITYDVSAGVPVHYVGSTPDARKVYFKSEDQLTADDHDSSVDLYMWSENDGSPTLTRLSAAVLAPTGDTDNCVSTWTSDCDVETYSDSKITSAEGNQGGLGSWSDTNPNPGYTDNAIAAAAGDVYFYSPEQLVAGKGVPGRQNLYVYREGEVHFVAALTDDPYCLPYDLGSAQVCSAGAVGRLQVTPNGRYAAFVTASRLTSYDNQGFAEMYRYDADEEKIACVSCRPDGTAPESDVMASQGGRFITDDGRAFFYTAEPLDPRDSNAGLNSEGLPAGGDVYEFVEGRPQLITSGTGSSDYGPRTISSPGLYGVSADGTDVYFSTREVLVGQDRNGAQLKFYDARTGGGFAFVPPAAPCAAAEECMGTPTRAPAPTPAGTRADLGNSGNYKAAKKAKKKKGQKRKRRKAKHHKKHKRRHGRSKR